MDFTLCCGQIFRWHKKDGWWYGTIKEKAFRVSQQQSRLDFENIGEDLIRDYFGLDLQLELIRNQIGKDHQICKALDAFWGLRLVRQDPWECLISYICATYKGIGAINRMLLEISKRYGEKIKIGDFELYTFPTADKLAKASEKELMKCGLGYRSKYVHATTKMVLEEEIDLNSIRDMPYFQAKKILCNFPGVGAKVADCVLLFSLDKLEAFPVDVWIKRVILRHYSNKLSEEFVKRLSDKDSLSNTDYERISSFAREYFGEFAGYAQEYLYHYERMHSKETCSPENV